MYWIVFAVLVSDSEAADCEINNFSTNTRNSYRVTLKLKLWHTDIFLKQNKMNCSPPPTPIYNFYKSVD